jgi:small subunit ribosomal protein S1
MPQASMEEFEALLNESFKLDNLEEGSVVKGKVLAIENGQAIVDIGYKMEGRVELKEFARPGQPSDLAPATRSRSISTASRTRAARR